MVQGLALARVQGQEQVRGPVLVSPWRLLRLLMPLRQAGPCTLQAVLDLVAARRRSGRASWPPRRRILRRAANWSSLHASLTGASVTSVAPARSVQWFRVRSVVSVHIQVIGVTD